MNEHRETLCDVFIEVVEKLAFMFGDPCEKDDLPDPESECIKATISFEGTSSGIIELLVPSGMCAEMAANILGMDEDDETAVSKGTDSLKELLNVTCGNFLTAIAGETPVFNVSAPQATRLDLSWWPRVLADPESIGILIDDYPVLLRVAN